MNIIKLKDMIMPDSIPNADYFNKHLKGKYAYWVQMRYIVSFDHMRHEGYIACEEDITKLLQKEDGTYPVPYGVLTFDVYDYNVIPFIDVTETDRINNIMDYRIKNKYVTDPEITIDELKLFRSWLAQSLLNMDKYNPMPLPPESPMEENNNDIVNNSKHYLFNEIETHVLEYYANNMYDNTIKILSNFSENKNTVSLINTNTTQCGCGNSDLSSLYNTNINTCDPISIYKKNIYEKMVVMFSDVNFWLRLAPEFIGEFKMYIDNIIKLNLKLVKSPWLNAFTDCGCTNTSEQENSMEILKRLSISLGYIKDDDINGHKNYITTALLDWAKWLYEDMQW